MACDVEISQLRATALVLRRRVEALYAAVEEIYGMTHPWTLDDIDAYLPSPSSVKSMVLKYEALIIESLTLSDSLRDLKQCDIEIPDHIVFPSADPIVFPAEEPIEL